MLLEGLFIPHSLSHNWFFSLPFSLFLFSRSFPNFGYTRSYDKIKTVYVAASLQETHAHLFSRLKSMNDTEVSESTENKVFMHVYGL